MDTETLKTFLLLANTKNFSRTAEIMFVSQSAVTARIKSIEAELNKTLFVRNKTSVELTPHGKIFIHYAKSICNLDLESKKALDVSGRFTSRLSIAAPETIWQSTVFSKFRTLIEKYPNISFNVNVLHSNDIIDGILDDNIDIGFVLNRPTHRRIETVELWNCSYVLVKSPALKLNSRYFSPDTLDDFPYIDMDWGMAFSNWLNTYFYPRIYPFHTIHGYLCMNLLLEGLGVCFLPERIASSYIESGRLEKIPYEYSGYSPIESGFLVWPKNNSSILTPYLETLKAAFQGESFTVNPR